MKIHKDSWSYRVYNNWHFRKHGMTREAMLADIANQKAQSELMRQAAERGSFIGVLSEYVPPKWFRKNLDLCHYFRVLVLFAPARWAVHGTIGSKWYYKPWPYILSSITLVGLIIWAALNLNGLVATTLILGIIIAGCVGILALLMGVGYVVDEKGITPQKVSKSVSHSVVGEFIKAKKRKICPIIEVEDDR